MGRQAGGAPFYVDGIIDEVGIWARSLSDAEVTQLYNAGAGLTYPFTLPFTPTPMMHMMQMAGGIV